MKFYHDAYGHLLVVKLKLDSFKVLSESLKLLVFLFICILIII